MTPFPISSCQQYVPEADPCRCLTCFKRWMEHSKAVREDFTHLANDGTIRMMEHRLSYLNQSNPERCLSYRPIKYGETIILCECGRLLHEHNIKVIVQSKTITKADAPPPKPPVSEASVIITPKGAPCGHFAPLSYAPGTCRWCNFRYIAHEGEARGLELEEMTHLHTTVCRSVLGIGQVACSCLSDVSKQALLDSMAIIKPQVKSFIVKPCPEFAALGGDPQATQTCTCGRKFYDHDYRARQGLHTWTEWRAIKMTNAQVVKWFINLGTSDLDRMTAMKKHIETPDYLDSYAPPPHLIRELFDLLPLKLRSLVPIRLKALKTSTDAPDSPRTSCFNCKKPLKESESSLCSFCAALITTHESPAPAPITPATAPVVGSNAWEVRTKPPVCWHAHTEHSVNRDSPDSYDFQDFD